MMAIDFSQEMIMNYGREHSIHSGENVFNTEEKAALLVKWQDL